MAVADIAARKRELWQGRSNAERFANQIEAAGGAQRLRDAVELDIVGRCRRGTEILDVGIGTGRIAVPLAREGIRLTGIDTSEAMLERCRERCAGSSVEVVAGELECIPFESGRFDTAISIDTFAHFPDWMANLDELLRVVKPGGRVIVDLGSRDHIDAVAAARGVSAADVCAAELAGPDDFVLRLSVRELCAYAHDRGVTLVDVIPIGAVFGSLIPNYWQTVSFAYRSGALDRLVSWLGADRSLFTFGAFIERRIVGRLAPAVAGRKFAVFERVAGGEAYREPPAAGLPERDERGAVEWQAEFVAHTQHEQSRSFAIALLLAARPQQLPAAIRREFPPVLLDELFRAEACAQLDERAVAAAAAWAQSGVDLSFLGVDLVDAFAQAIGQTLRERWEDRR